MPRGSLVPLSQLDRERSSEGRRYGFKSCRGHQNKLKKRIRTHLQTGKVSMSTENFKKALQLSWDQGSKIQKEFDQGLMDLMKMGQNAGNNSGNANYGDIFNQMFGGGLGKK